MASTPAVSVVLFAVAALLGAVGQWLYKIGAAASDGTIRGWLLNPRILGGVACYVAVMVLFVAAWRRGGSLAVLYAVYASTFLWAALIGWVAEGEALRPVQWVGFGVLVLGMVLVGS